ncbi:MAG: VanZ family protein [Isosphaeraceae bacterium]
MVNRLRLASAILWTVIIFILCWTPDIYLPVQEEPGLLAWILPLPLDKLVHAGIFAVFGVLWLRAARGEKRWYLWILVGGIAAAALTELGQEIPIVHRDAGLDDVIADIIGVILAFPAFFLLERFLGRLAVQSGREVGHEVKATG